MKISDGWRKRFYGHCILLYFSSLIVLLQVLAKYLMKSHSALYDTSIRAIDLNPLLPLKWEPSLFKLNIYSPGNKRIQNLEHSVDEHIVEIGLYSKAASKFKIGVSWNLCILLAANFRRIAYKMKWKDIFLIFHLG